MSNELGHFLEELRGKISLREAAKKSGLSHTYIRDLELGKNRKTKAPIRPSADTLIQLAKAYNHSPNDILKKAGYIEEETELYEISKYDQSDEDDEPYNALVEINKLVKKYGIEQMGFFDIEEWKQLGPEDIQMLEEQFKLIVKMAKQKNQNKDK
jgi:transcriptional regulator with XRE-family HTH domain